MNEVLDSLVENGSCFDCASYNEIVMVSSAMLRVLGIIDFDRISFGNTMVKESDIKKAYDFGVRLFAVDSIDEVDALVRAAKGCAVFCRIKTSGNGADWPLTLKFGCNCDMAVKILKHAHHNGLIARGISFHVGSQQRDINAWEEPIKQSAHIFKILLESGIKCDLLNLGGGFPVEYKNQTNPTVFDFSEQIYRSIATHFKNNIPKKLIIEPGRAIVAEAGIIITTVVGIKEDPETQNEKWAIFDIGYYGGLVETTAGIIQFYIQRLFGANNNLIPYHLAGPTCDSSDIIYHSYPLPADLKRNELMIIFNAGAYTHTYSSNGFNGIKPLRVFVKLLGRGLIKLTKS